MPPQVVDFWQTGAPLLESAEPVVLCDPQAESLHGDISTDPLWSALGPGDALPGHFKGCAPTEVTTFWCVSGRSELCLGLLSPRRPSIRRGAEEFLPFDSLIRLR